MAEWIKTGDGPTEEWHRLTGDVPEPGTMRTACGMRIPDDETVERHPDPPDRLRHAPDREDVAHG